MTTGVLKEVRKSVWDARTKWYDIGIELKIEVSVLDAIKHDSDEVGSCLTAMLKGWLKQTTPSPTWEALVDALKSPTVGCGHLAEIIEKKFCERGKLSYTSHLYLSTFCFQSSLVPRSSYLIIDLTVESPI